MVHTCIEIHNLILQYQCVLKTRSNMFVLLLSLLAIWLCVSNGDWRYDTFLSHINGPLGPPLIPCGTTRAVWTDKVGIIVTIYCFYRWSVDIKNHVIAVLECWTIQQNISWNEYKVILRVDSMVLSLFQNSVSKWGPWRLNKLGPRENGPHFPFDISKSISLNENI